MSELNPKAAPINILLRFFVSSFTLLAAASLQLIYRQLIYHRYFSDEAADFVDFLTMANISIFLMDEPHHGYYLHGKSLHRFADCSLEEMKTHIDDEKKNLCKDRGLVDGKDTFEMFLTPQFRSHYNQIYANILAKEIIQQRASRGMTTTQASTSQHPRAPKLQSSTYSRGGGGNASNHGTSVRVPITEEVVRASEALGKFLKQFIQKTSATLRWDEGEREGLERVMNVPPYMKERQASVFYDDPNYNFQRVLMMGNEYSFTTFLVVWYGMMDVWFSNTFVSILMTYLVNKFLSMARAHWG
eukprot:66692_1